MLVLDRKIQEGFWIDGGIYVKVLGIGRQRVKLGIEAPRDIKIVRDELRSPKDGQTSEGERSVSKDDSHLAGSFRPARRRN